MDTQNNNTVVDSLCRRGPFIITHVLIISGPPDFVKETEPYHLTVHEVGKLPDGFTISPTWGDAFLMYKDDGTVRTACRRNFFSKTDSGWSRWPFGDTLSPEDAIAEGILEGKIGKVAMEDERERRRNLT